MEKTIKCKVCGHLYDSDIYKLECPMCAGISKFAEIIRLNICSDCGVAYQAKVCPLCKLRSKVNIQTALF